MSDKRPAAYPVLTLLVSAAVFWPSSEPFTRLLALLQVAAPLLPSVA